MRIFVALLALLFFSTSVYAQGVFCGPRAKIIESLEGTHKDFQSARGLSANGNMLEVFSSEAGAWTILMTRPDGLSCVAAAGRAWEVLINTKLPES